MRVASPLMLLALSASLAACATAPTSTPGSDASAPAPLADHDWFVKTDDGAQVLTYGRSASDDVWLELSCRPGTASLQLAQYLPGEDGAILLESGGDTERWPARLTPSEMGDADYLAATARADAPVFLRFRRLGWLASHGPEGRTTMAAHPGSGANVERFFAACG